MPIGRSHPVSTPPRRPHGLAGLGPWKMPRGQVAKVATWTQGRERIAMGMLTDGAVPTTKHIRRVMVGLIHEFEANEIRALMAGHAWPVSAGDAPHLDDKEDMIDRVLKACAEILGHGKVLAVADNEFDDYYRETGLIYTAANDPYDACVMYDTREDRFVVGSMGDYITDHGDRFDEEACAV